MKKIFLVAILAVMVTCMAACSNNNSNSEEKGVNIPMDVTITTSPEEEKIVPEISIPSDAFIKTALQFIDEYPNKSKELENMSAKLIQQSDELKDMVYTYLNYHLTQEYDEEVIIQSLGFGYEKVEHVKVFIHNYKPGGSIGCASFNNQDPFYNYDHDKFILAAGLLDEKYPDNLTLAEARIAAYILTLMSQDDVEDICILTNIVGKKSYDFTFENKAFKEIAKKILTFLDES